MTEHRYLRRWSENSRNRHATGSLREIDPRRDHATAAVLSLRVATEQCRASQVWTTTSLWATAPASSKCELLMSPDGLSKDTTRRWTCVGNGDRHKIGAAEGLRRLNATPPMPDLAASQSPPYDGCLWTISAIEVGRSVSELASHFQSASSACWWRRQSKCQTRAEEAGSAAGKVRFLQNDDHGIRGRRIGADTQES